MGQRLHPSRALALCGLLTVLPTAGALGREAPDKLRIVFRSGTNVFVAPTPEKLTGFDVELVERFLAWHKNRSGRALSVQVTLVKTVNELMKLAQSGQCEVAIGSITVTEAREKSVDFSTPYLPVRMVLIARAGWLPQGPYQEILSGKRVGAVEGSTNAARLQQLRREVSGLVARTRYPGNEELFRALLGSKPELDAAVTDSTHYWDQKKNTDLVVLGALGPEQGLGIVFPEGSSLRPVVDAFLEEFLHSASYFNLLRQYFGNDAADMVRLPGENR